MHSGFCQIHASVARIRAAAGQIHPLWAVSGGPRRWPADGDYGRVRGLARLLSCTMASRPYGGLGLCRYPGVAAAPSTAVAAAGPGFAAPRCHNAIFITSWRALRPGGAGLQRSLVCSMVCRRRRGGVADDGSLGCSLASPCWRRWLRPGGGSLAAPWWWGWIHQPFLSPLWRYNDAPVCSCGVVVAFRVVLRCCEGEGEQVVVACP